MWFEFVKETSAFRNRSSSTDFDRIFIVFIFQQPPFNSCCSVLAGVILTSAKTIFVSFFRKKKNTLCNLFREN